MKIANRGLGTTFKNSAETCLKFNISCLFTGLVLFSVNRASRDKLGLPHNWARVKYWLNFNRKLKIPVKPIDKIIVKKCPEIAKLECYSV